MPGKSVLLKSKVLVDLVTDGNNKCTYCKKVLADFCIIRYTYTVFSQRRLQTVDFLSFRLVCI